ncbi:MAG: NIL domain-containing protein [Elusimicrobia bacterium]|nr:NIL domain-containing protein [Elusimicrobiota bacterium]MBP9127482.1 NIL domain-containing protein [Elusimicrobiota bacterium]MBP9699331.1 NIL domain-containing protein [Elusimicrobiota bacterium]
MAGRVKRRVHLVFRSDLVQKPVTWEMSKKFDIVFNVRRAKITEKAGESVLELEGDEPTLDAAVAWLKSQGVTVEPVTHDTLEG